jgi:hypothetical protein
MITLYYSHCGSIDHEKAGWRSVKPTLDNGEKSLKLLKILWITENPLDY